MSPTHEHERAPAGIRVRLADLGDLCGLGPEQHAHLDRPDSDAEALADGMVGDRLGPHPAHAEEVGDLVANCGEALGEVVASEPRVHHQAT